jgi:hypothetical protein
MKKGFDAVAWMRQRRTEIDREDGDLSWQEKREKTRRLLAHDPLWLRRKQRVVGPVASGSPEVQEGQGAV